MSTAIANATLEFLMNPPEVVRLLEPTDCIPASLTIGFEILGKLDRDWVWVATKAGEMTGILAASPCHGVATLWRLAATEQSPITVMRLLRQFFRDVRNRGYVGYIVALNRDTEIGRQLIRIVEKAGGRQVEQLTLASAPLPREGL